MELESHVLSDLRRVFTQREVVRILSGGRESGNLNRYLERNPLLKNKLPLGPINFKIPGVPGEAIGPDSPEFAGHSGNGGGGSDKAVDY